MHIHTHITHSVTVHTHDDVMWYTCDGNIINLAAVKAVLSSFKMWFGDGGKSL
jgi:hypothetical protein